MSKSAFGKRLAELRNKRSLTQTQLAKLIGMSHSSVASWETGTRDPNTNMVTKLADFFSVTTDYLLGQSTGALIEDQLENIGETWEWLSEQTKISLSYLKRIDSINPIESDYIGMDRIAHVLGINPKTLRVALARQEPPVYDGPVLSAEEAFKQLQEDFADEDFDQDQRNIPHWATDQDTQDFKYLLETDTGEIIYNGTPLTKEQKDQVKKMMEFMFWQERAPKDQ